jgi:hypothetical protein
MGVGPTALYVGTDFPVEAGDGCRFDGAVRRHRFPGRDRGGGVGFDAPAGRHRFPGRARGWMSVRRRCTSAPISRSRRSSSVAPSRRTSAGSPPSAGTPRGWSSATVSAQVHVVAEPPHGHPPHPGDPPSSRAAPSSAPVARAIQSASSSPGARWPAGRILRPAEGAGEERFLQAGKARKASPSRARLRTRRAESRLAPPRDPRAGRSRSFPRREGAPEGKRFGSAPRLLACARDTTTEVTLRRHSSAAC